MSQFQCVIILGVLGISFTECAVQRCGVTQLTVKLKDGSTRCHNCSVCPPGQGFSHICSSNTEIPESELKKLKCIDCVAGETYSGSTDSTQCGICPTCSKDQVVNQTCSVASETKCRKECYSKDNYFSESSGGCEPCSSCCNDTMDRRMDECKKKGKSASDSCSIQRLSECIPSPSPATTNQSSIPAVERRGNSSNQSSAELGQHPSTKPISLHASTFHSQRPKFITIGVLGVVFVIAAVVLCRRFRSKQNVVAQQKMAEEGQVSGAVTIRADTAAVAFHSRPENPNCEMTLSNFADEEYRAFEKVCVSLDTETPGCGNYECVAKHYGVDHYTIKSRFEKYEGGPSKALFEWLRGQKPELTVGKFIDVLRSDGIKRNDVADKFLTSSVCIL